MSGFTTPVGAIQDALATAIAAQDPGCPVALGYPVGGPRDEYIWIAGSSTVTIENTVSTLSQRDELLEIDVYVSVAKTGTSYTAARDRCLALVGEVESALAADRTLGGLVLMAVVQRLAFEEWLPEERKRAVGAIVRIVCDAST